jgi:broad specificity phosphatase PhoE
LPYKWLKIVSCSLTRARQTTEIIIQKIDIETILIDDGFIESESNDIT